MRLFLFATLFLLSTFNGFSQANFRTSSGELTENQCLVASKKREKEGDWRGASDFMNKAALIRWDNKDYSVAIQYFKQSLLLNRKVENKSGSYGIYSNLAMLYADLNQYDSSLIYFQRTLEGRRKSKQRVPITSALINTAVVLNNLKRYSEAIELITEALILAQEVNDTDQMRSCYGMLAESAEKMGDTEKARYYFEMYKGFHEMTQQRRLTAARQETEQERMKATLLAIQQERALLEIAQKNTQLNQQQKKIVATKDTLSQLEANLTEQELLLKLTQQKSQLREMKLQREKDLEKASKENQRIIFIAVILFLTIFSLVFLLISRQRRRDNRILIAQKDDIQQKSEEIEMQAIRLKELNDLKDKMFSIIAHDLRSPLAQLEGVLSMAESGDIEEEELKEYLPEINKNLKNTTELTNNLLIWAKGQIRGAAPQYEIFNLHELAQTKLDILENRIKEKNLTIENQINAETLLKADKSVIDLLLRNLLGNAVKFCRKNDSIFINSELEGSNLHISIKDTGVGISDKNLAKIFSNEKFTTRGTKNEEGTGLGLMFCKEIIEKNKGTIGVKSEQDKGTIFHFTLPLYS